MIDNARFERPGAGPGLAAGWTLRSVCQALQIAPFGPSPPAPGESFERWSVWTSAFAQGTVAFAVFAGNVAVERFDWPIAALWLELSGGVVAGSVRDSFAWPAAPFAASWAEVASIGAAFAGSAREAFEQGWRAAEAGLVVAHADAALARAAFAGLAAETFEAGWTANPTLR